MKFALRNILNAAVTIAVLMPTLSVGSVIARNSDSDERIPTFVVSHEDMMDWLANTDAELTTIGNSNGGLSPSVTSVIYCDTRSNDVCGGHCTNYTGGPTCLDAPNTQCILASNEVSFCDDRKKCQGSCSQFSTCRDRLDNNACWTPGTNSILIGL